jgi:threonine dehydratase
VRLVLDHIADAARHIPPELRDSPQFVSGPLSDLLGCTLTLKVETLNPIRSFKGRGAATFVARAADRLARGVVCASAGNFGQAMAYACRPRLIPVVVYAARKANPLKIERMRSLGADVRLEGDNFDAAKAAARLMGAATGAVMIEDGLQPEISEGAGTIAVELLARGDRFDVVVVPVGNGALIGGMARWIKARAPETEVVGVCSRGAASMADSWRNGPGGAIVSYATVDTIADGIAVREPIPEAVEDMLDLVDDVLLVDDAQLIAAMRLLHLHAGLVVEPAGAAGVAALLADSSRFAGKRVATPLCGGNLTAEQIAAWLG